MAKLLNASEAAKLLHTSRPTLYKAIEKKIILPASVDASGPKFEPKKLQQQWHKWKEYGLLQSRHTPGSNKGGRPKKQEYAKDFTAELHGKSDAEKLIKAKALQATIAARRAQLDLEREQGDVVSVDEVRKQGAKLGQLLIGSLNAMPSRIAPLVAPVSDVHAIHEIIQEEVDRMIVGVRYECGIDKSQ